MGKVSPDDGQSKTPKQKKQLRSTKGKYLRPGALAQLRYTKTRQHKASDHKALHNTTLATEFEIEFSRGAPASLLVRISFTPSSESRNRRCLSSKLSDRRLIGILLVTYTLKGEGWCSLFLLLLFGVIIFYTGILLKKCLESSPSIENHPDITQSAFGFLDRIFIAIALYAELYVTMYNKTKSRGFVFVTIGSHEEAKTVLDNLEDLEGIPLRLAWAKPKTKKPSSPPPSKQLPVHNHFVANLHFDARSKDLLEFFKANGANVVSAEVIFNDNPRQSAG
ncbi:hypothetical protein P3L10_014191 [Capsicum annuum]